MTRKYTVAVPRFKPTGVKRGCGHRGYVWRLDRRIAQLFARGRREGECLIWTGKLTHDGYAQTSWRGKPAYVHVIAYELAHGPVPEGLELDHQCNRRACFESRHLTPVTHRANVLRSEVALPAVNARKTHCKAGHEFTPDNMYSSKTGARQCITCCRRRANTRYDTIRKGPK